MTNAKLETASARADAELLKKGFRMMKKAGITAVILAAAVCLSACGSVADENVDENVNVNVDENVDVNEDEDGNVEKEKTVLTLGTVSAGSGLRKQVDAFNQQNSEYQIEVKTYGDTTVDGGNAINTMQMEIVAGEGPDIIDFGYLYSPSAVSKGITEDLSVYMDEDADFQEEDYFMNVIRAFAVENKVYAISPQFTIKTAAGRKDVIGSAGGWNMQEIMTCFKENAKSDILFPGDSRREVFAFLCRGSMGDFVDWAEGTCFFDGESFREMIAFVDLFPVERYYEEDYSSLQKFQSGEAFLYPLTISNVYACATTRTLFGDVPINYIGFPMEEKNGNIAQPGNTVLGIGKNCKHKDAAWEFIKSFMQEEYQSSIEDGIPLLKSELERRLKAAEEIEYEQNEKGEMAEKAKDYIMFEGDDPIDIYCIEEQDAADMLEIINSVETAYAGDDGLYNIVLEEIVSYLEEGRDLDSVIEIIQSRASIYISEQQ